MANHRGRKPDHPLGHPAMGEEVTGKNKKTGSP
jgi:hypothetical protein